MTLRIRDRVFRLEAARLWGELPDPHPIGGYAPGDPGPRPLLALQIVGAPERFDDDDWQPMAYHDWLSFPSRDRRDLANRRLTWTESIDPESGAPNGAFYVWQHADIHAAELRFGARNGTALEIEWSGVCDILWDNDLYSAQVPFSAHAQAIFEGVIVRGSGRDDAEAFRARLGAHLDVDDFAQGPIVASGAYEDGVAIATCTFSPIAGSR